MTRHRPMLLILSTLFVVAFTACGGDDPTSGDPPGDATTADGATGGDGGEPADDPSTPAAAPGGNGGGAGEGDGCRLATEAEVSAAIGVEVATAEAAGPDNCTYKDEAGTLLYGYVYIAQGGRAAFDSQKPNAEVVDGIGDGALWFPGGGMYVLKGDAIANMTIFTKEPFGEDDAAMRAAMEEIAQAVAGRM